MTNTADDHKFDRGLSSFDVRHVWSLNGTYELPFGPGKSVGSGLTGFAGKLVGGWQLSSIATLQTGPSVNLRLGFERSQNAKLINFSERPDLIPGGNNNPVVGDGRDPLRYYDTSQFLLPDAGYFGNLGRATLIGPGVATLDLSFAKSTLVNERVTVQFRAEAFNALNRANFSGPNSTVFTSPTPIPSATAGRITNVTTTARQIQFALKVLF